MRLNALEAGKSGRRKICFVDWDNDGDLDFIVDGKNAVLFENVREADGRVWFEYKGALSDALLAGHTTAPTAADFDGDGIFDLLLGAEDGHFYVIKNKSDDKFLR